MKLPEEAESIIAQLKEENKTLREENSKIKSELKEVREENQDLRRENKELREGLSETKIELKEVKNENKLLKEAIEKIRRELRKYHNENTPSGSIPPYLKPGISIRRYFDILEEKEEKNDDRVQKKNMRNSRPRKIDRREYLELEKCPKCSEE